ncbi:hypothetical protein C8R43DRAFT_1032087 [Mycena crocata]|nr:hypothetical protein C8R43DRAFT_1032087 [Mycena crocata]
MRKLLDDMLITLVVVEAGSFMAVSGDDVEVDVDSEATVSMAEVVGLASAGGGEIGFRVLPVTVSCFPGAS